MPVRILVFFAVLAAACGYALWRGGAPERWTAWLMAAAAAASALLPGYPGRFVGVDVAEFAIDCALLAALLALAAKANRFWPLWVAALQLVAITIHGARAYDPMIVPVVYARAVGEVAYPMIGLLIVGTSRHLSRVAARGDESDWSQLNWW